VRPPTGPGAAAVVQRLEAYFAGDAAALEGIAVAPDGTEFQKRVWAAIARIPLGETISYAKLAVEAGSPRAVRAAGTACGANPVAVIIPCHRVVRADGTMGNYGGGIEKKRWLLDLEGVTGRSER
jgi:methylated-DNA-[protein]-cysteine S-methyltransferase